MNLQTKTILAITLIASMTLSVLTTFAVPQIPHKFYGSVTIDGIAAQDGVTVEAKINGVTYFSTTTTGGQYGYDPLFMVPADDPDTGAIEGGNNGDTVEFYVSGIPGDTYVFSTGAVTQLDLYVSTIIEINLFEGWNLIGLPTRPENPSIEVVLADVLLNLESVWAYEGETSTWSSYAPGAPSDLSEMVEDRGYWIKMKVDDILTFIGGCTGTIVIKVAPLDGTTVRIGNIMPGTTSLETGVPWVEEVIEPALNEYADLLGYDVTFEILCEQAESQAAVHLEKVQYFKSIGVDLIHGGYWSSMAQAALSYVNENNMLLFSSSSTSPILRIADDNLFRMCPDDTNQAPAIAEMLWSWGIEHVVVIQRADAWADGIYNHLLPEFEARGGMMHDRIRYAGETIEFSSILATADIKIGELTAIYGAEHVAVELIAFTEATTMVTQAIDYTNLWNVVWFGSDGTAMDSSIRDYAPDQAVHLKILSTLAAPTRTEKFQILNDKHMEMFGYPLDFYGAAGYDVYWAIARAVLEAQSTDPSDVIPLLPSICDDMFGASGWCKLNEAGDRQELDYDIWGYGLDDGTIDIIRYGRYDTANDAVIWYDPAYTVDGREVPGLSPPGHGDPSPEVYVGSIHSDVYHRLSCIFVQNILPENRIYFPSREAAELAGYRPCLVCNP